MNIKAIVFFFFFCFFFVLPILIFRNKLGSKAEIKSKIVFPSILIQWEMVRMNIIFILPIEMAITHKVLSLWVVKSTWLQ